MDIRFEIEVKAVEMPDAEIKDASGEVVFGKVDVTRHEYTAADPGVTFTLITPKGSKPAAADIRKAFIRAIYKGGHAAAEPVANAQTAESAE